MEKEEKQNLIDCTISLFRIKDSLKEIKIIDSAHKYMLIAILEILIDQVEEMEVIS